MNYYKAQRLKKGLSRKQAAKLLKTSIFNVRNIEQGQRNPGRLLLIRMSFLYDCTTDELLKNNITHSI